MEIASKVFKLRSKASVWATLLLVSICSCTPSGTGILGSQGASSTDENPVLKNAPFAYEIAVDTISYNSCVMPPSVTDTTIHGLKIGVSEGFADDLGTGAVRAGLKLRTEFLKYIGSNFTPEYGASSITPTQIARLLNTSYSIYNTGAYLNFAVRRKSDFAVVPDLITIDTNTIASPPRDATVFPYNLASGYLGYSLAKGVVYTSSGTILSEGSRVYNLSSSQIPIPIEGTLYFNASADSSNSPAVVFPTEPYGVAEVYSQSVRDRFNLNTQLLTATFGGISSTTGVPADDIVNETINNIKRPTLVGSSNFDVTTAYGRGYYLKFESGSVLTSWPKNLLNDIKEIDLEKGTPVGGASWSCEQIVIAHSSHWNNNKASNPTWINDLSYIEPNCSPLVGDDTTCLGTLDPYCAVKNARALQVKRIRRHYAAADWNIGLLYPARLKSAPAAPNRGDLKICLAPRTPTSCYLPTSGILAGDITHTQDVGIQYDRNQECYLTMATITGDRDLARKRGRCAQYASICTRNSGGF